MKKRIYILMTILTVSLVFFFISQGQILANETSKMDYDSQKSRASVEPDRVEIVEIDSKQYRKIYMTSYKLTRKFGTGLDLSRYKGFYYQEVLPDINYIADSIAADPLVDSVQVLDFSKALIWITKDNYILKYGEEGLDPDDGEYCGYRLYILPMPAPYLPIYPDYPKDKPEIMRYRTPYSRTFRNNDGTFSTILTIRPTSYRVKEGGEVNWIDIPPDEPIPESIWRDEEIRDVTRYAMVVELDNDGQHAYNFVYSGSHFEYVNVGAGGDFAGIHKHLYQRECSQFSTLSWPAYQSINQVKYRTYVSSEYPEVHQINSDGTYDYYRIKAHMLNFYHNLYDYNTGNYNDLYYDIGDGAIYHQASSYWYRGDAYVYAIFNSAGRNDFENRIYTGRYSTGLKDIYETGSSSSTWEAVVLTNYRDQLIVNYTPQGGTEETLPSGLPKAFYLFQNFPNPVFSRTVIKYAIPEKFKMELKVYDASGREIATLLDKEQSAGFYTVNWDIKDISRNKLANGVYFYRLKAGNYEETKKMVIVR